jgi:hypothetical protein
MLFAASGAQPRADIERCLSSEVCVRGGLIATLACSPWLLHKAVYENLGRARSDGR